MIKEKEQPKKASKKEVLKPLITERVEVDGETKIKITYPDGRIEYREL